MKQRERINFIASASFCHQLMLHEEINIHVELLSFSDLIADQNCFVFGALDRLDMYRLLALLRSFTALFLWFLY